MKNLKHHFNDRARMVTKRREARQKQELDFFILWHVLLFLTEMNRQLQQGLKIVLRPPSAPN